ncbi:MAG TPA: hypothetical protein VFA38_00390 [Nitrospirales bacterium]|nr:hypothetical protein [Nitrospirales bacterium]
MRSLHFAIVTGLLTVSLGACAYDTDRPVSNRPAVQPKYTQPPPERQMPAPAATAPRNEPAATPTMAPREQQVAPPITTPDPAQSRITERQSTDLLQACLDRIPKDASAGQRSFAEQTCNRDYAAQGLTSPSSRPFAAGTQGDTLEACMSRIPSEASAGQRMIAEESCRRDEDVRRQFGSVPGR